MPYQVSQILRDLAEPVEADFDEPLEDALDRMLDKKFSQLPVVKGDGQARQFYFITYESILSALHNFGSKIEESGLRVDDALVRTPNVYRATDDLFELLEGMREMNAAIIVDDNRAITNIVTTYDTTRFFRQWAEDIMQVRDIEYGLKRILNCAFKKADGEIDEVARRAAVEDITSSNKSLRTKFGLAVKRYLTLEGQPDEEPNQQNADEAFKIIYNRNEQIKDFTELTLEQYIQLFFTDVCWPRCQGAVRLAPDAVRNMLEGVRDTRNKLAHFREEEVTAAKRMQLKRCADWLSDREKLIAAALEQTALATIVPEAVELPEVPEVMTQAPTG
jgi:CBS domain-containing protein